jgi:5S rRNA maturation endonuclease (ribonuclease M5)
MDEGNALQLFERLGCSRIRISLEQVMCSCPFPENHKRGDRRSSFSAKINDNDKSPFICYGCHEKGTLEWLAVQTGNEDLVPEWKPKKVKTSDWFYIPPTNAGVFARMVEHEKKPVLFKDDYLKPFVGVLSAYLKDRGVNIETAKQWELGLDREYNRATFTVRDYQGRLAVVIGRDITGKSKVKYSNYVLDRRNKELVPFIDHDREEEFIGPTKSFFLYGEHLAWKVMNGEMERRSNDLILVEGPTDVLAVWQMGWNVVGVMGSYVSKPQIEKLVTLVPKNGRLVILADGDEPGEKLSKKASKDIDSRVPVYIGSLPDGADPGKASEQEIEEYLKTARVFS